MNPTLEAVQVPVMPVAAAPTRVSDFVTLTKPGITVMVGITTAVGYYVASHETFDWKLFLHLIAGTLLSSGGASAFNMLMERKLDAKMDRTKSRPLAAGRMAPVEAAVFGATLCVVGLVWLAVAVNPLTAALSAATMISYLALYTPLKTKSSVCTLVGAIPGALPPVMGWAAARGSVDMGAGVLFMILFFWQLPHFLALAWMYREDYRRGRLRMLSLDDPDGRRTGRHAVLWSVALAAASIALTPLGLTGAVYAAAAALLGAVMIGLSGAMSLRPSNAGARRLFLASVIYLPLLMAVMVLNKQ